MYRDTIVIAFLLLPLHLLQQIHQPTITTTRLALLRTVGDCHQHVRVVFEKGRYLFD